MRHADWTGSTWERVCHALFDGDEARMLAWGRRYLAAHPGVGGPEFHLGAEFRRIVGARNREQWWRTAVDLLARRETARAVPTGAPLAAADAVRETVAEFETAAPPLRRPDLTVEERLRLFDEATERQRRREAGLPIEPPKHGPPPGRWWKREDLYDRVRPD